MLSSSQPTIQKQRADVVESTMESLTSFDMWAIGITVVIGGQYFGWNVGLSAGVGSGLISLFITSIGYICLVYCIAELSSGLPFAGGNYGLARVTAGIYPGFLVGCYDTLAAMTYVATAVVGLGTMMTNLTGASSYFEPLYWFVFYFTAIAIHSYGGTIFWKLNSLLALVSIILLLIYILGAAKWANFSNYAVGESHGHWFQGGLTQFMRQLYLSSWFYVGVEGITIACQDVPNPKHNIPRGYLTCVWTLFFTGFSTFLICVSLPSGSHEIMKSLSPLEYGFHLIFQLPLKYCLIFSLPALYATAFGFMFFYGRQIRAMGNSGLLNPHLGQSLPNKRTPFIALLTGSLLSYAICLCCYFFPGLSNYLFQFCILCCSVTYLSQFSSYFVFNSLLSHIKREFVSPLGLVGALVGSLMFLLVMISIVFFQEDHFTLIAFVLFTLIASIYYYFIVKKRQYFSDEEKTVLMSVHIVKCRPLLSLDLSLLTSLCLTLLPPPDLTLVNTKRRVRRTRTHGDSVLSKLRSRIFPESSIASRSSSNISNSHSNTNLNINTLPSNTTPVNAAVPQAFLTDDEDLIIEPEKIPPIQEPDGVVQDITPPNFETALPEGYPVLDAMRLVMTSQRLKLSERNLNTTNTTREQYKIEVV